MVAGAVRAAPMMTQVARKQCDSREHFWDLHGIQIPHPNKPDGADAGEATALQREIL